MSIAVVIAAKNEEKDIKNCLDSVKWVDEIVVVDDMSTDNTVNVAKEYTDKVYINDSKGDFHRNKNMAIEKASCEWILSLDADEVVPEALSDEIRQAVKSENIQGYYLNRRNYFLGKWVKGCDWYPDYIIRLFRKGVTQWPLEIHDTPNIEDEARVGYLKNDYLHYSYKSMNQFLNKFVLYTTCLAREEVSKGTVITWKNFCLYFFVKPLYAFVRKYFIKGGFKDGFRGFFISFSSYMVLFVTYSKVWEKQICNDEE